MAVIYLEKPVDIVRRSGWQYVLNFRNGLPPGDVADNIAAYKAVVTLAQQADPGALPLTFTSDDGDIVNAADGSSLILIGRGVNAYWPEGRYDLMWRVYRDEDLVDRYVVRSHPNRSPVRVISPPSGTTPIPAGSPIALPLAFSQGYAPGEVFPGYPLVDVVAITSGASRFASLEKPASTVVFPIRVNGIIIGTATMDPATCGVGPVFRGTVSLISDPFVLNPADYLDWAAPGAIVAGFRSGGVTLSGA